MLLLLEESWNRVQDALRERVGSAAYAAWLADLRPILLERGTIYLEASSRLAADRVATLFRPALRETLSRDIGTELDVEIQAREADDFGALEVSPQQPVVDEGNRTAFLLLKSLLPDASGGRFASSRPSPAAADGARERLVPTDLYFLHGDPGVGKTFLLRWWREQLPLRAMWFDLPALLKAFQSAHQDKRVERLHDELSVDLPLVIDEVHRIANKPGLQKFLLEVLRARARGTSPTVFASRWHPREIRELDPSLGTSWLGGFVCAIERPGPLGRLRYLRALEGAPSRNGRAAQVESIAQQVTGTWPELRAAWARSRGQTVPRRYLELIDPGRVFVRLRDRVAERLDVSTSDLVGKGQGRQLSRARKILALMCQQHGLTGGEIGRYMGRTRAAVSYMLKSLQKDLQSSSELRLLVEELT